MDKNEEVIVYKGNEIQKRIPGLLEMVMLDDVAVELRKMNTHFSKRAFQGAAATATLNASNQEQFFDTADGDPEWISVSFLNAGPDTAVVQLNRKGDWVPLFANVPQNFDFTGADNKICHVGYKCLVPGDTAVITAIGKY